MVRDRFLVTPLACGWQVIHQASTYGRYTTHCEAALAAMLLAQIASEAGIHAEVVLETDTRKPAGLTHPRTTETVRHLAAFAPKADQRGPSLAGKQPS